MGSGASQEGVKLAVGKATDAELKEAIVSLDEDSKKRLLAALSPGSKGAALNILLHEDLTMKGGAQIWLTNCGQRLKDAGHNVKFILPEGSLIIDDCESIGPITKYSHEKSAADPEQYREEFTKLLAASEICVTLVRQKRDKYQNVRFMADCIAKAGLKTFLISKTGTPDASYEAEFYGGALLKTSPPQCCTITIAEYTRKFIMDNFGIDGSFIQTIYNGTDTERFKRTPEMAIESKKRYPIPEGRFVVGSIGRFVAVKGQKILLKAAKKLIESGKLPNVHLLMVGEGELKEDIEKIVKEDNLGDNVSIHEFTKEPFYVFEACNVVAMPSFLEGLPNVLLEALAMETPCVASRIMGCPEVVIDGKTGYCFEAGDLKDESTWDKMAQDCADAIEKIAKLDDAGRKAMAEAGKKMVFEEHDKVKTFQKMLDVIQAKASAVAAK
jgi:glycosyltransferase involved in cell wall biosynthesis